MRAIKRHSSAPGLPDEILPTTNALDIDVNTAGRGCPSHGLRLQTSLFLDLKGRPFLLHE